MFEESGGFAVMDLDLLLHLHRAFVSPQSERMPISERELVAVSRLDGVNGSEMVIEGDIFTPWGSPRHAIFATLSRME